MTAQQVVQRVRQNEGRVSQAEALEMARLIEQLLLTNRGFELALGELGKRLGRLEKSLNHKT